MWLRRIVIGGLSAAVLTAAVVAALSTYLLRPAFLKPRLERELARHLNLEVSLESLTVSLVPNTQAQGTGLVLRVPNRPDLPPFITIDHFQVSITVAAVLRHHVGTVHVGGLKITVPPADVRRTASLGSRRSDGSEPSHVIIDTLETHDAELTFVSTKPGKRPLSFSIPVLTLHDLGFNREVPYDATVINPIPKGVVQASGRLGPWLPDDPTSTPLGGVFTFTDADLSTINGIGGQLQSTGSFEGALTAIAVKGEARIPDFSLDLGGQPASLAATYDVLVDGTDGTTTLKRVDAKLARTPIVVTGAITNLPGPGRHDVALVADVPDGRLEDLLALAIDTPAPPLTGDIRLHATVNLPPGKTRTRDRIALRGRFGLAQAAFSNADVQTKLQELSRRGQGKDKDDPMGRVMTSLRGEFVLAGGVMTLSGLSFQVPGATVGLDGTYTLDTSILDFRGTLRMPAPASQALGGFKSIFIRPFDGMLRKNGATELPIRITGVRTDPKFGLEIGKVFRR